MILIAAVAAATVSSLVNRGFDAQLRLGSLMLVSLMSEELAAQRGLSARTAPSCEHPLLSAEDREAFADFARWRRFRIWYGGRVCWASPGAHSLKTPQAAAFNRFAYETMRGQTWRYYTYAAPDNGPIVQVGEPLRVRHRIVARMALTMVLPFLVIAGLLLAALLRGMRIGLGGLYRFGDRLAVQRDRPPFRPLQSEDWPRELQPLTATLNRLFERIEAAALRERRFIDMAAHQLRTPLAGLSIEAQLAARSETPEELDMRLQGLNASTRRIAALMDQVLVLARVETGIFAEERAISVRAVLASVIADQAAVAARRGVEIAVEGDDLVLFGHDALLHPLLANLIDNAVKHSPDGAEVLVEIGADRVIIVDRGEGMSEDERKLAFERFWKASGNARPGSGLGLAIALEAAKGLGAHLVLEARSDAWQGLQATVLFDAETIATR
jgi:signal transduction histidine kinase